MKHRSKRFLSILLSLVLMLGLVPGMSLTAYATEPQALNGNFTINDGGDKVNFAPGNLQAKYEGGAWSWGFAQNQWDCIGADNEKVNGNGSVSSDCTIDFFGWSTASTTYGIHNSTNNSDYSGDFVDWGNAIGSGWRTLSADEWNYLLLTRTTTSGLRFANATLFENVHGLIIFPDNYTHPDGLAEIVGQNVVTGNSGWNGNSYNAEEWAKMENAGAVFLPAAGHLWGRQMSNVNIIGFYQSSSNYQSDKNYAVAFQGGKLENIAFDRSQPFSVRLVYPVSVASVTDGETTTEYSALAEALDAWNSAADNATLTLLADVTTTSTITVSGTKILDLNGYTISTSGDNSVITVSGGTLTVQDSSISGNGCITGGKGTYANSTRFGGGIYVDGGILNMSGGTISNNTVNEPTYGGYGGGVAIVNHGHFNMTGGTITSNTAGGNEAGYGGGVSCNDSTFEMSGASNITNNTAAHEGGGGGVLLVNSIFTMKNGTIQGNIATDVGLTWAGATGVQINKDATLIIQGGEIKDAIKNAMGSGHLKYGVTYKVVEGTWSNDTTEDVIENVESGSKPASVPVGMKASEGYAGGAWDTDPADATITEATTFTYTFTAKQAATVTEAPTAKNLTYTGSTQELVTAGQAEGGEMQYVLGEDATTAPTTGYTKSIPTATEAGTYYVWYKVVGDENHTDTEAVCVTVTITPVHTVTWKNWDGTVLWTEGVADGETPVYKGEDPVRPGNAQYEYDFSGWTPEVVDVTADAEYTAIFNEVAHQHTYVAGGWSWKINNGNATAGLRVYCGCGTETLLPADSVTTATDGNEYVYTAHKEGYADSVFRTLITVKVKVPDGVSFTASHGISNDEVPYGTEVTLASSTAKKWLVNGTIVSQNAKIYKFIATANVEITVEDPGEEKPTFYTTLKRTDARKARFEAGWSMPNGYSVQSAFFYRIPARDGTSYNEDQMLALGKKVALSMRSQYATYGANLSSSTNDYFNTMLVVTYKDKNGTEYTYYSDVRQVDIR